ncbi:MAG: hypothetical protein RLZZ273_817 [Bacteroidota bacterium]|jgi:hypothetical protein
MTATGHTDIPKAGMQHTLVLFGLTAVLAALFYFTLLPWGVQGFVSSLFAPHELKQGAKYEEVIPNVIGVMEADDASKTMQQREDEASKGGLKTVMKNSNIVFDFSNGVERTKERDGYDKTASWWVLRNTEEGGLGENSVFIEPPIAFTVLALALGFTIAIFATFFMPSSIGFMAQKVDREIHHNKTKIRLQTGFTDEIVDLLTMPDTDLDALEHKDVRAAFKTVWDRTAQEHDEGKPAHGRRIVRFEDVFTPDIPLSAFRAQALFVRINEFFSDFVVQEIVDTTGGIMWSRGRHRLFPGLRLYMAHHFTEKYSNNVTGLAYFGAAILIVIIGIRGLKFIPGTRPSLILAAISLEGTLLALLAFGLVYTGAEERIDKLMKKMEDASKNQLETMKDVSEDMHSMASALVGETSEIIKKKVELAIAEALASDDNVKRVVSDKVAEKIIVAMREAFPTPKANS